MPLVQDPTGEVHDASDAGAVELVANGWTLVEDDSATDADDELDDELDELDGLTRAQLFALADERQLSPGSRDTKDELRALLTEG